LTFLFLIALAASAADLPPIPPLPPDRWPSAADAEPFARALLGRVSAASLAQTLAARPDLTPAILRNLGTAVMTDDAALRGALGAYLAAVAKASPQADVPHLVTIAVVDPLRYGEDNAFRARVDTMLPRTIAALSPVAARAVIEELTRSAGLDFDTAEKAMVAAHVALRSSEARRTPFDRADLVLPDDIAGPIEASIFSLSTSYVSAAEAKRFLEAVRAAAPHRRIVVLGDQAMGQALAPLHVAFAEDQGRAFSPWPRDPFIVARTKNGSVVFVNRPNLQPHREEDRDMVRALVQELPAPTDEAWKKPRWTVGPAPFHNGQILRTPEVVWISMHSVEQRALELLALDHVPSETFDKPAGVARYLGAVRRAAAELQDFYRLPVRFVHAMDDRVDLMPRLAGGAGFDLDSIVTILPRRGGKSDALVGDLRLGATAARLLPATEWAAVRKAYGIHDAPDVLRQRIAAAQPVALQEFLDEVARELDKDGMTVRRLPLINVPKELIDDAPADVLLTWNNVVLERRGTTLRAEGFASLLPSMDAAARRVFEASGYRLTLYPPLLRSIILGGGYRCASNHLRPPSS
jgi:hypothetical protein